MTLELFRMDGRVAMVTGAGRGTGKSIALTLAEAGAKVAICARGMELLNETAREIEAAGGEALAVRADVSSESDLKNFVDRTMEKFGKIDCLVNNAGGNQVHQPFFDWSHDQMIEWFKWNVSGAYVLSQLVGKHMIAAGKGSIVNISSEAGRQPTRSSLPYGVAKAALNHLTTLVAEELAPKVRVNTLSLGPIMTPNLQEVMEKSPDLWSRMLSKVPLRKIGDPECVALATLFFCSDASSFITGTMLPVAGGMAGNSSPHVIPDL